MKRSLALTLLCIASLLVLASWASARTQIKATKFTAALNAGQEVPHPKGTKAGASGRFTATFTSGTLKWTLTFKHLTGPATAAHIHNGVRGKAGPVVVALCGQCKASETGTLTGEVAASTATAMGKGKYYVNVHTAKNPNGEIRGQITVAQ
jgi:CHRD domain-containing protein